MQRATGIRVLLLAMSCCRFGMAARIRHKKRSANSSKAGMGKGTFHMRVQVGADGCQVMKAGWGQLHRKALEGVFEADPKWLWSEVDAGVEHAHSDEKFLDFWGPSEVTVHERAEKACDGPLTAAPLEIAAVPVGTETRCLICSGDSANRIDVVFMGDGYTMNERTRFFEDMQRLTDEMFAGETFRSYLPLFNIWAIHAPSQESGIGYNGSPKDTTFQLYKQGTQHRGVFPSSSGRSMARQVCQLADGCDYPSIIGNDEFYGGLGGEFVIGTRSKTTGTLVLRHEMGHNFVDVGEEYDGGSVYSGVNAQSSLGSSIKWSHWLTEPSRALREERMSLPLQEYPWADLGDGSRSFSFSSDGSYASYELTFTVSGCPEEGSLKVKLDGQPLAWVPQKPVGAERPDGTSMDRLFYHFGDASAGLTAGTHTVTFETGFQPSAGAPIRQLCSLNLHEYGNEASFSSQPGYVGAYPTWNSYGSKSYRPTNEECLMRNMESTKFCSICKEGMWEQFLMRMSLIDTVDVSGNPDNLNVELKAVPLAHLRESPVPGLTESYQVVWFKDGQEQGQLTDTMKFSGTEQEIGGDWEVLLTYSTSEVRSDPGNLLSARVAFTVETPPAPTPAPPPGAWTISGSGCVMDGNCITSRNFPSSYGNSESCTINLSGSVSLTTQSFSTESGYDFLTAGGTQYAGTSGPPSATYTGTISWATDYSVTNSGWRLCSP